MTIKAAFMGSLLMATSKGCTKHEATPMDEKPGEKLPEQRTVNLNLGGYDRSFIVYLPLGFDNAARCPSYSSSMGGAVHRRA